MNEKEHNTQKFDEKDLMILRELQKDCRQTNKALSKKLKIPEPTIRRRIKHLETGKFIKKYAAIIDPEKVGLPSMAIALVKTLPIGMVKEHTSTEKLSKALAGVPGVCEVKGITGQYDLFLKIRGKNERDVGQNISKLVKDIPGISTTETCIVVYDIKDTTDLDI